MTGEQSLEALKGVRVGTEPVDEPEVCDSCSAPIAAGDVVGVFFTRNLFQKAISTPYAFRLHCLDCEHETLLWSPEGYAELLVTGRITDEKTLTDIKPRDYSPADEGPPYDPVSTLSKLLDFPEQYILDEVLPPHNIVSPQDFIHTLLSNDLDPEKIVDMETGEPTITDEERFKFFELVFMKFNDNMTAPDGALFDRDYRSCRLER